ncbi:MAG: hypothetical protein ABSF91_05500 [Bacteroidota bacterium]
MGKYVTVIEFENVAEATLIQSILENEGIPFVIRSYHDSAYDGLFQFQKGWGRLEAPEEFKDQILLLYKDMNQPGYTR